MQMTCLAGSYALCHSSRVCIEKSEEDEMSFQLWDRNTGDLIGDFEDEASALDVVREEVDAGGREAVDRMSLLLIADLGRSARIMAEGEGLLDLLQARAGTADRGTR